MNTQAIYDEISKNASTLRELHVDMHRKHKLRSEGPAAILAWQMAAEEFRNRFDALAFPGGYEGALERLLAGDPLAMEASICFLELRPFFYHSGYMFKDLLRKSRKAPLTDFQRKRLQIVEAAVVQWRNREKHPQQSATTQVV